ncbi:116afb61-e14b-48f2-b98e-36afaccf6bed [Thermothielavioides terrestris]|uniref:116afb61-e14b-48f2-b98e-36afaccf6bed n=1 Tax=Thermothielavioides terrestris TaxID=2587410 RepID=A0A446B7H7_9PEZI|nr:116afb61-e14b-48f2-b98e-36afaccf6bed [Thermothielavioides terrestris]
MLLSEVAVDIDLNIL